MGIINIKITLSGATYMPARGGLGRQTPGASVWTSYPFFTHFLITFFTPQKPAKNYVTSAQDGSWGQLDRFRTPTWHPKSTQNPHFSRFKTYLILRCAKTQNLVRVLGMDHIFATPGPPEILQKSMENRS